MEPTPVQPLEYAKVQPSNRAAVASLIFGLLLFIPFVAGIVAIVLGRKGKQVALERNGHGSRTAKAGYILGIVNIALSFFATTIAVSLIIEARQEARQKHCALNLRQIGMALMMYSMDYGGQLPATLDETVPYFGGTTGILICPETGNPAPPIGGPYDYVYVAGGIRLGTVKDPGKFIVAHEAPSNHGSGWVNFLYADGHTERWMQPQAMHFLSEVAAGHNPPREMDLRQVPVGK